MGRLLILACSARKRADAGSLPAVDRYVPAEVGPLPVEVGAGARDVGPHLAAGHQHVVGVVPVHHRHLGAERDLAVQGEREEAAHDVVVGLLVRPGQLFAGYDAATSGPMEGRFRVAVQNAVRNVIRTRRRHDRNRGVGQDAEIVAGVVPSRLHQDGDDEVLKAFMEFLRREVGEDAVRLLDRRLDGISLRQLAGDHGIGGNAWAVRRLVRRVREAALEFARRQHDDEFVRAVERLLNPRQPVEEWADWSSPYRWLRPW